MCLQGDNNKKEIMKEIQLQKVYPLFSLRRLAKFFDCKTEDGKPATETIRDWWHSGKIPPPDCRISRKAIYWKYKTIMNFIDCGSTI